MLSALFYIRDALASILKVAVTVTVFSVGDWDQTCQKLLGCYCPEHQFSNMNDGYDGTFVAKITAKQSEFREQYQKYWKKHSQTDNKAKKDMLASKFKDFVLEVLADGVDFPDAAPCMNHGAVCPTLPPRSCSLWIDLVSPSCQPWSPMGKERLGWLASCQIPVVCWAAGLQMAKRKPDIIFLEEVKEFDMSWIEQLSDGVISWTALTMEPHIVGLPTCGERLWACGLGERMEKTVQGPFHIDFVGKYIERTVEEGPAMFRLATCPDIREYMKFMNSRGAKLCDHPSGKQYRPEDCLSALCSARLECHRHNGANVRRLHSELVNSPFFTMCRRTSISPASLRDYSPGSSPRALSGQIIWKGLCCLQSYGQHKEMSQPYKVTTKFVQ